ncbi:MAG: hypothetical protein EOO68_21585 [Moraxellaceae bacterium]|nr:MAG: hypothetical protein EOO68_21585 [Moraxellaceae bacterium]
MYKTSFLKKVSVLAFGFIALPTLANNDKGFYLGLGAAVVDDRQDFITIGTTQYNVNTKKPRVGEIIGGYKYNNVLGGEIRIGSGFVGGKGTPFAFNTAGTDTVPTGKIEREIGDYQSIYYKAELVNDEAKLYALLGYSQLSTSVSSEDLNGNKLGSSSESYSGVSYGVGIGFIVNERFNVNFEYRNICEELYDKPNTAGINIDYRF